MLKRLTLLVVCYVMSGCFAENYSFCPPDERAVTLHFRLPDPETHSGDTFADEITTVTTVIYDAEGNLVQTVVTDKADHDAFQGLRLTLAPGTYRVVSWGNSSSTTRINRLETSYDEPKWLDYRTVGEGRMVENCDPLYYAPNTTGGEYLLTVDPETGHEGTIDFRHAHRRVEIYVAGFVGSDDSTTPVVRLTGLPAGLEFLGMGKLDEPTVNSQSASRMVTVEDTGYALSAFRTFYMYLADYTIGVEVLDPVTGDVVFSTTLNEHIDAAADTPETELTLRLLIDVSLIDVEVGVTVPNWGENEVDYGYSRK